MSLSVIVVALDEERRLPLLLKSIEKQMPNSMLKEIILVDNGSCDNTLTIMKAFEKKYSICSVFQNTMCLSEVYDFATRIASGTYISYLDADMALPLGWFDTVEKLVKTYGRYCAGFVARLLPLQRYHGPLNRFLMAYFLGDTARDGFWKEKTFHSGGLVIRREVAQRIGFRKNLPSSYDGDFFV